jgi:hypothetical protein
MATVTPLTQPEGTKPSEIQIEIQNLIEGRRKIRKLIAELNKQRAEAELAFLRASSRDLAGARIDFDRSFVDSVFNKYKSVKQAEDQTTQRITALGEIGNKMGKRINHFKQNNPEDLIPILKRDLPFHQPLIHITAQHIVASWSTAQPIRTIRLVGHTDPIGPEPYNVELGRRRALEVKGTLINAIERLRPGLSRQINIVPQSLGESRPTARDRTPEARARNRRVEIFLSTMAAAPVPPVPMPSPVQPPPAAPSRPVRIPTPEEAARAVVPSGPETPEERIRRILTAPPPTLPPRRSFSEMFWRRMDERLNSTMSRVGVPLSLRGPIRDAAHAAIRQGTGGLLNSALDETGLSAEAKGAIRVAVRAAAQTPIQRDM